MIIRLTANDIAVARAHPDKLCPMIIASSRAFGEPMRVNAETLSRGAQLFYLPWAARIFISRFDAGLSVEPFSFRVAA